MIAKWILEETSEHYLNPVFDSQLKSQTRWLRDWCSRYGKSIENEYFTTSLVTLFHCLLSWKKIFFLDIVNLYNQPGYLCLYLSSLIFLPCTIESLALASWWALCKCLAVSVIRRPKAIAWVGSTTTFYSIFLHSANAPAIASLRVLCWACPSLLTSFMNGRTKDKTVD